jgi:hypothetical protein
MASQVQGPSIAEALKATAGYDMDAAGYKIMLLKNTYTPNGDHQYASSLASTECDATNYTGGYGGSGRKTLSGQTLTYNTGTNRVILDATDPATWAALGGASNNTLRYAAIIKEDTSDAASPVFAVLDFGSDYTTNGGDFSVTFNADGILYISV